MEGEIGASLKLMLRIHVSHIIQTQTTRKILTNTLGRLTFIDRMAVTVRVVFWSGVYDTIVRGTLTCSWGPLQKLGSDALIPADGYREAVRTGPRRPRVGAGLVSAAALGCATCPGG